MIDINKRTSDIVHVQGVVCTDQWVLPVLVLPAARACLVRLADLVDLAHQAYPVTPADLESLAIRAIHSHHVVPVVRQYL